MGEMRVETAQCHKAIDVPALRVLLEQVAESAPAPLCRPPVLLSARVAGLCECLQLGAHECRPNAFAVDESPERLGRLGPGRCSGTRPTRLDERATAVLSW